MRPDSFSSLQNKWMDFTRVQNLNENKTDSINEFKYVFIGKDFPNYGSYANQCL